MAPDEEHKSLLGYISAGSTVLFAFTAAFVVVTQTIGPSLGLRVGNPSDTVLVTMIVSATAGGSSAALREWLKRRKNGGPE